jgi:small-conductance mechanosensitive channel
MSGLVDFVTKIGPGLVRPLLVFAIAAAVGYLVQAILFRSLRIWAKRTTTDIDDIVVAAFGGPARLWVVILAADLALKSAALSERAIGHIDKALIILWILSLTLAISKLATSLFVRYGSAWQGATPVTTLGQNLIRLVIISIGVLLMLNSLGISVTPILTALGVGGLAVALGLQETLANLFAGLFVSVAGKVRVGDYIKLSTGEEGFVTDVSWRSTTIRMLANNLIIVPNSKLAQAIVTNYSLPEPRMSLLIPIGVSYDSDPQVVERVLIEEAVRAAGDVPGLRADPPPFVRFIPGFEDFSLGFTLIVQVDDFVSQYLAQHELRKRIFARFQREGIKIPFPTRTLYMENPTSAAGRPAS